MRATYQEKKAVVRKAAQDWQRSFDCVLWSPEEVAAWESRFERLGRRFGLLREFQENEIIRSGSAT